MSGPDDPTGIAPRIIRRHPTGEGPIPAGEPTALIRRAPSVPAPAPSALPSATTAIAAAVLAIVGGWPMAVVTTDLTRSWWDSDRLFCLALGFLALLFAASTLPGIVLLLRGRPVGRYLTAFGSAVALLAFGSVFLAGARVGWPVYVAAAFPVAALVMALHPATRRWTDRT